MISIKRLLKLELEPYLKINEFEYINKKYHLFFSECYSDSIICKECSEQCLIPKNKDFICPINYMDVSSISTKAFKRYKFSIKKFTHYFANKNNISYDYKLQNNKTVYFGSKIIGNCKHNFYYLLDLTKDNQLTDIAIQRLKSLNNTNEKLIIITPDSLIKDNELEMLIKELDCYILELNELLEANYLINIQDMKEYDFVVNAKTYSIIIYGIEYCLNKSPDTFSFIYNLAQRPKEILNIEEVRGVNKAYKEDKTLSESTRKMKGRFINGLKKVFLEQNKPIKTLDDLIKSLNKNENYYLNIDKEKLKIIGTLPN